MKILRSLSIGIAALGTAGLMTGTSQAASLADTYKGATVTLVIAYSMGGTYGQYAQLMAQHLRRFIPGDPNIIVQSMPGAGGLKGTNYAYRVMPKNGMFIFEPPDSIIISELLNPKAARYKSNEFIWLGNVAESNSVIAVTKASGVKSFADAQKREVIMGSTGKGSQTFLIPAMLNGVLGSKFRIVMGYKGAAGSTHAMELGETHGVSLTWTSLRKNRGRWFDDSPGKTKATPIIQVGFRKEKDLMDVPLAVDLAKTKEDKQIVNFMASLGPIGRGATLPPGAPKALVAPLRSAFDKMVADKRFRADAQKRKLTVDPKTGPEVQAIVADVLTMKPAVVARARKLIFGK